MNAGNPGVAQLMTDALSLCGVPVDQPQAVMVAAEAGRLVSFSPDLPPRATLATGRRGRPPHVANLLRTANTSTWKADLLLGTGDRWVSASLKSNPGDLHSSLRVAADTPHAPRIGITTSGQPGLTRDPETNAVLVHVPVYGSAMALSKLVLRDVVDAFSRHLSLPGAPLREDATGIGRQLNRWKDLTVRDAANTLLVWSRSPSLDPLYRDAPMTTGTSDPEAAGALIVVNPIVSEDHWSDPNNPLIHEWTASRYGDFDPID